MVVGCAQVEGILPGFLLDVETGVKQSVEQDEPVHAHGVHLGDDVQRAGVEGAQLHGDRNLHGTLHTLQGVDLFVFDLLGAAGSVDRDRKKVELETVNTGLLHANGPVGPRLGGGAVEAADDRDGHRFLGLAHPHQVLFGTAVLHVREQVLDLGVEVVADRQLLLHAHVLKLDLFLEEALDDHGGGAGVLHAFD